MNKEYKNLACLLAFFCLCFVVSADTFGENLSWKNFYKYRNISQPRWNHESTKVAFTVSDRATGKTTLYLALAIDGKLEKLMESDQGFSLIDEPWSHDGSFLYLRRGHSIWEIEVSPKKERTLLDLGGYAEGYIPQVYFGDLPPYGSLAPSLSPDGSKMAYSWQSEIYVLNIKEGGLRQITHFHPDGWHNFDPQWSPDGNFLLFTSVDTRPQHPFLFLTFEKIMGFNKALIGLSPVRVGVIPDSGGDAVWMAPEFEPRYSLRGGSNVLWSPDGSAILINKISLDHTQREIITADPKTGLARIIYAEKVPYWISPMAIWMRCSPDGKKILFTSEKTGWNHIYVMNVAEGEPAQITDGAFTVMSNQVYDGSETSPMWSKGGDKIYFPSNEGDTAGRNFYVVSSAGGGRSRLTSMEGVNSNATLSPDENWITFVHSDLSHPQEIYITKNREGSKPLQVTDLFLPPELKEQNWVEKEVIHYKNANDGTDIAALLYYPAGFRKEKRYPAVVFAHGAGYAQTVYKGNWGERFLFNEYLAREGYVVLAPDFRGSSGYGRKFRNDVHNRLGFVDLDDVVFGVEHLKKLGIIDEHKVGIWGHSYGGFMTCMAMFRAPDTFRAGVSSAPVTDWERFFYLAPGYNEEHLGFPWDNPEGTEKCSPLHYVKNLKNPFLLLSGMQDIMHLDSEVLVLELLKHRKKFDMVFYPNDHHSMSSPKTVEDKYRRIISFFNKHLQGQETQ